MGNNEEDASFSLGKITSSKVLTMSGRNNDILNKYIRIIPVQLCRVEFTMSRTREIAMKDKVTPNTPKVTLKEKTINIRAYFRFYFTVTDKNCFIYTYVPDTTTKRKNIILTAQIIDEIEDEYKEEIDEIKDEYKE